ncbi:MAG: Dipeptide/tripeptide permease [Verrucomicrobiaceae bacterium]|nr:Dipeptide/tripeptide permease [Verrucomicrobiaceae bacterium]
MPPFTATIRQLPRPFWVLIGATFVNRFGVFVWPFLTLYMTRNGNTPAQAGWAVSAYSVGAFGAAWIGGWLADRMGRNVAMALSALGSAACMMALSQSSDWRILSALSFLTGLVAEAGSPASSALVQDIVPVELHVTAFAVWRFAINLGWSLGPMVAGMLAEHSFFWLFAVDAMTSAFFGIIAWIWLPRGRKTEAHRAGWRVAWQSIRVNKPFLALFAACLCCSWSFRQTSTTFMLHLKESGHSMSWSGVILAVNGIMICIMEMPLTAVSHRIASRTMIALGFLLMGAAYLVLIGPSPLWMFVLCVVVFTLGEMFAFSRQPAYAAGLAPEDMRGRYSGFISFAWAIGGIVGSAGGLQLYGVSPAAVWIVSAVLGAIAALLILMPLGSDQMKDEKNAH